MARLIIGLFLVLTSCTYFIEHGRDGDVYLELEPNGFYELDYYWDDNTFIPSSDHYDFEFYYQFFTNTGVFEYEYDLSNGFTYWGHYELFREFGSMDGFNGNDRFYTLYLGDHKYGGQGELSYFSKIDLDKANIKLATNKLGDFEKDNLKYTVNVTPTKVYRKEKPRKN